MRKDLLQFWRISAPEWEDSPEFKKNQRLQVTHLLEHSPTFSSPDFSPWKRLKGPKTVYLRSGAVMNFSMVGIDVYQGDYKWRRAVTGSGANCRGRQRSFQTFLIVLWKIIIFSQCFSICETFWWKLCYYFRMVPELNRIFEKICRNI